MSWRTVIISSQAKLDTKMGYLVVRGYETQRILLDEIGILVLENPMVSLTGCLIEALTERKVKVIFCDSKHNPMAELIPHHGSHDCSAKIRTQISWSNDTKAVIWREIVSDKIRKQAELLQSLGKEKESELIQSYIGQIELFDITNREGHAAKVYFNALFGMNFTRGAAIPINAALNYGYSIILSVINREVVANGYLTQLGIFHSNMFNHYNMSCDLMEPYRVLIDRLVQKSDIKSFETVEKHLMWHVLEETVLIDGKRQTVLNAIKMYVHSVFEALNDADSSKILFFVFEEHDEF